MKHNIHYHSKREKLSIVKKYWARVRLRSSKANAKSYSSISHVKRLRWLTPSSLAACNIHLSLWLILFSGCISIGRYPGLWHFRLLGSPMQFRLHFYSFVWWPLRASTSGLHLCHTPCLSGSVKAERKSLWVLFSCTLHDSITGTTRMTLPSPGYQLGMEPAPLNHVCSIFCVLFLSGSRRLSFTSWKLSRMHFHPEGTPPLFQCVSGLYLISYLLQKHGLEHYFLVLCFSLNGTFLIYFCLICSFSW